MSSGPIDSFSGQFAFLSNFWPHPIKGPNGWFYPSNENAYQAFKTLDKIEQSRFTGCMAGQAKKRGRGVRLRPDWEEVKIGIMRELIAEKFQPNTSLATCLLLTGDRKLIEGNTWGDLFWGMTRPTSNVHTGEWVGLNWLGELLMRQREALQGK